jgi:hypothetical protein
LDWTGLQHTLHSAAVQMREVASARDAWTTLERLRAAAEGRCEDPKACARCAVRCWEPAPPQGGCGAVNDAAAGPGDGAA